MLRLVSRLQLFKLGKKSTKKSVRCMTSGAREKSQQEDEFVDENQHKTTHFGFETVREDLKHEKVRDVFSSVAAKYDLMNDVMSFGIHRLWKDKFMSILNPMPGMKLLDVAGGTGDIAFRFLRYYQTNDTHDTYDISNSITDSDGSSSDEDTLDKVRHHVTVCDINEEMLNAGKSRPDAKLFADDVSWVQGNAEKLPFEANSFDAYTIAFGIRNTTHYNKVLNEAYRVLKPGGRFLCLEFSQVNDILLRALYDLYSFQVIPVMGQVFARDWKSYQYLVESIRQFPVQEEFKELIQDAGFKVVKYENMSSGVVAIHSAFKL